MKIWLDVDDLLQFADRFMRPSGIQRLSGELYAALNGSAPNAVGFVAHDAEFDGFRIVAWAEVAEAYRRLTTSSLPEPSVDKFRSSSLLQLLGSALFSVAKSKLREQKLDLRRFIQPGDVLCAFGAPWHNPHYARQVAALKFECSVAFAVLVYDLLPILRPEFFERGLSPNFKPFMRETLPLADVLFSISKWTARDIVEWARSDKVELKCLPQAIPVGSGFDRTQVGPLPRGLQPNEFVLFVSTIEVRKNHLLAFRVWNRLLRELPRNQVPTLVFAGRIGWMVADLLKAMENTDHLHGKLQLIENPDDATLASLYGGCRFTLFPSHYEGWGLPVSDSLSFGKICVASNATSIPEAGGEHCIYIDPDNVSAAYETVHNMLVDPSALSELQQRLVASFRPTPWIATAHAVLQGLGYGPENNDLTTNTLRELGVAS